MSQKRTVIDFVKMSGAGNDFVLVDNRENRLQVDWSTAVPALCDRHYGIGADGVLVIERDLSSAFLMTYYNPDGSSDSMCGNGGRCAAAYVMGETKRSSIDFRCNGYLYHSEKSSANQIKLIMRNPMNTKLWTPLELQGESFSAHYVDTGAPHAVIFLEDLPPALRGRVQDIGISELGKHVRYSKSFAPVGVNVDFVEMKGPSSVIMRTYEKGVEGETLACGTGAMATAIVSNLVKGLEPPVRIQTRSLEYLVVWFEKEGEAFTNVTLEGPAKICFRGQYTIAD